jgi:hypothetical protein
MKATMLSFLVFALAISALPLQATQLQMLSVEEMGRSANAVVQGKVLSQQSYWNPDHTKILTEIMVSSDVTHKGTASGAVRIVQLGGTVDNVRVNVHGALQWTAGEEVLVFLESYRDGAFVVTGLSQGKFNIVRDGDSGATYVSRMPLEGVELAGGHSVKRAADRIDKIPLSEFLAEALGTGNER